MNMFSFRIAWTISTKLNLLKTRIWIIQPERAQNVQFDLIYNKTLPHTAVSTVIILCPIGRDWTLNTFVLLIVISKKNAFLNKSETLVNAAQTLEYDWLFIASNQRKRLLIAYLCSLLQRSGTICLMTSAPVLQSRYCNRNLKLIF